MSLSDLTVPQLQELAATKGVSLTAGLKKAEIVAALEAAGASAVATEPTPDPPIAKAGKERFFVHLLVSTLAHNPMVVEATDAEDARRQFCEANGIQGSKQTWRIRHPQGDDEAEAAAVVERNKKPDPAPEPEPEE